MDKLNPLIFLLPAVALILVILMFIYLLKKVEDKAVFTRFVFFILILAFLLNFGWEVIQMPLYKDAPYTVAHIVFCALASLADSIHVLLIYFGFAIIYKDQFWIKAATVFRILILMLVGGIGAVLAEMRHVSAGNWSYDDSMPIIPIANVGLSPVLQFTILPALIYYLSYKMKNYSNAKF